MKVEFLPFYPPLQEEARRPDRPGPKPQVLSISIKNVVKFIFVYFAYFLTLRIFNEDEEDPFPSIDRQAPSSSQNVPVIQTVRLVASPILIGVFFRCFRIPSNRDLHKEFEEQENQVKKLKEEMDHIMQFLKRNPVLRLHCERVLKKDEHYTELEKIPKLTPGNAKDPIRRKAELANQVAMYKYNLNEIRLFLQGDRELLESFKKHVLAAQEQRQATESMALRVIKPKE